MKKTIFLFAAVLLAGAAVNAQSPVVDSIRAKYQTQAMPEALTVEKTFPVIGTYQLSHEDGTTQDVVVTLDSANSGMVWVEGLPEGKFKALLKKSPATYRVVAQKSESGKDVPEGTLIFDPATNTLQIALGQKFDDADPAAVFQLNAPAAEADVAATEVKVKTKKGGEKSKTKLLFYTATKAEVESSTSIDAAKQ